jgi:hypothetical protein
MDVVSCYNDGGPRKTCKQEASGMIQRTLEERVETLEETVAALVTRRDTAKQKGDWRSTIGMFAGDSVIRQIQEEGRQLREAERAAAQRDPQP